MFTTKDAMNALHMSVAARYGSLVGIHPAVMSKRLRGSGGPGKSGELFIALVLKLVPEVCEANEVIERLGAVPVDRRNEATSLFVLQMLAIEKGRADLADEVHGGAAQTAGIAMNPEVSRVNVSNINASHREDAIKMAIRLFRDAAKNLPDWAVEASGEEQRLFVQANAEANKFISTMEVLASFAKSDRKESNDDN
jgi:hypothetical protein